jgi:hypothetical protein
MRRRQNPRFPGGLASALAAGLLFLGAGVLGQPTEASLGTRAPDIGHTIEAVQGASDTSELATVLASDAAAPVRHGGDVSESDGPAAVRAPGARLAEPMRPTVWYRLAAAEYGVSAQLLEALHQVESNASPDSCIVNLEGSGATGPFQFKAATFAQFGVDANHDGLADICAFTDSLFSAARYLRVIGADADPTSAASRRALVRYGTDAGAVQSLARAYQERDSLVAAAPSPPRQ